MSRRPTPFQTDPQEAVDRFRSMVSAYEAAERRLEVFVTDTTLRSGPTRTEVQVRYNDGTRIEYVVPGGADPHNHGNRVPHSIQVADAMHMVRGDLQPSVTAAQAMNAALAAPVGALAALGGLGGMSAVVGDATRRLLETPTGRRAEAPQFGSDMSRLVAAQNRPSATAASVLASAGVTLHPAPATEAEMLALQSAFLVCMTQTQIRVHPDMDLGVWTCQRAEDDPSTGNPVFKVGREAQRVLVALRNAMIAAFAAEKEEVRKRAAQVTARPLRRKMLGGDDNL